MIDEIEGLQREAYRQGEATFEVVSLEGDTAVMSFDGQAEIGPDINVDQLKEAIAGQKSGDTENIVSEIPGVNSVTVDYSPFWVNKTPSNQSKIDIQFVSVDTDQ